MPWDTPSLSTVRQNNRDYITGKLQKPLIPNDYPRVLADANAGNAHLNLQYLDWQADQYLPDTAEKQFLDRHGSIWLVNADGSRGRKVATYAAGTAILSGTVAGAIIAQGSQATASSNGVSVVYELTQALTIGIGDNVLAFRALDPGAVGNLDPVTTLTLSAAVSGTGGSSAVVQLMTGGADEETDDELRARVLQRIQKPPMGGDADDYERWALAVPGVTRAWCSPNEMGPGTVTVRFMCDDLRATGNPLTNGFPTGDDVTAVQSYIDSLRPVAVRDFFALSPLPQAVNFTITNLSNDTPNLRAAIATQVTTMLMQRAKPAYAVNGIGQPAQTIYRAWVSEAISATPGVDYFDLTMNDVVMANNGCMGVLGNIS